MTQPLKIDGFNTSIQIAVPALPLDLQHVSQLTGGASFEASVGRRRERRPPRSCWQLVKERGPQPDLPARRQGTTSSARPRAWPDSPSSSAVSSCPASGSAGSHEAFTPMPRCRSRPCRSRHDARRHHRREDHNGPVHARAVPTQECHNLAYCFGIAGLWVVIPANGEATYLFGCPQRAATKGAYLLGGTDALASSASVRVWYDGNSAHRSGCRLRGLPSSFTPSRATASRGSFRPIVGCINLSQASKRSTVSARRATAVPAKSRSALQPQPRATKLTLAPGTAQPVSTSCLKSEKLVGSWSAVAYGTDGPPHLPPPGAVKIVTHEVGNTVQASITTASSIPYLIHIQIGAMCEPRS